METTRTVTIKISREELAEIIKDYLFKEGFEVNEKNIKFNVESVYEGYGLNECEVKKFTGCDVAGELKTKRNDNG